MRERESFDVAKIRADLGMTQSEFARALGTTGQTVSRWERDLTRPTGTLMRRALGRLARRAERESQ